MSYAEPAWLRGETGSMPGEARVQQWVHEESRPFMVLPFYENDVVVRGAERYMLWRRALSDGKFYPIPLSGASCAWPSSKYTPGQRSQLPVDLHGQ